MTMKYPALKQRIVDGVHALAAEYGGPFDAFALNTDDDGWTIYHTAALANELSADDLNTYFSPNEWSSKGSTRHLEPAYDVLVEQRDSISIEDVFETFATALLECRTLLPTHLLPNTWLTVASSDPSVRTDGLEKRWARELNSAAMVQRFTDWVSTFPPLEDWSPPS